MNGHLDETLIDVTLIYAKDAENYSVKSMSCAVGTTALALFEASGLLAELPVGTLVADVSLGIFSHRLKSPEAYVLQAGDRIEVYRPLLLSPMAVRRARAEVNPYARQVNPPRRKAE